MKNEDFFKDDDFSSDDNDSNSYDYSTEMKPKTDDFGVFQLRTDPTPLLEELRIEILRKTKKYHKSGSLVDEYGRYDLISIPNTKPMANDRGVEEIIMTVRKALNNHVVQGFTATSSDHKQKMRYFSDKITRIFWTKRKEWGINLNDTNQLVSGIVMMTDYFLSRTIGNEERRGYYEQFKESTSREIRPSPGKPNLFSKMFNNWSKR